MSFLERAIFQRVIGLAVKKIRREANKTLLGESPRHRALAVVESAITMNQNDRRPFAASRRSRKKTVDDFFAAAMGGMHGHDPFSHVISKPVTGPSNQAAFQPAKLFM